MISVEEATAALLSRVERVDSETVPLSEADGRLLSGPIVARFAQPPFPASAMDGYAIAGDAATGDRFDVIGESAAGHPFDRDPTAGEAVRIFTGAPVPGGCARVILQEDVARSDDTITIAADPGPSTHIRPAGGDFAADHVMQVTRPLGSRDIALIAAMGHGTVSVARRPVVAIVMTGDELVAPGEDLATGQITASNGHGLAAMLRAAGAKTRVLPIARDTPESLTQAFDLARGADLILTIGGASVGDHDLVAEVARTCGLDPAFHKVAMRPGKPLLAGKLGGSTLVGLPGNPVSAMVCGLIFVLPMIRKMLGLDPHVRTTPRALTRALPANGPRAHYMRGQVSDGGVTVFDQQDSSLLSRLAAADTLVLRPPEDTARAAGETVMCIDLPD